MPGQGTIFQFRKYLPYKSLAVVFITAVVLHCGRILTIRKGLVLVLLSLWVLLAGLAAGFLAVVPYFNCILLRNHEIAEQPFTHANLTQRMTREAVDFIERYKSGLFLWTGFLKQVVFTAVFFLSCRNSDRPFLLYFPFILVHTALFTSAEFRGTSRHGIYGDAVHEVDWSVGRSQTKHPPTCRGRGQWFTDCTVCPQVRSCRRWTGSA